ncbi:MAG: hypothetical protein KAW92_10675 [Candidatus Cloacimonetes bacterium]|nr:hypothetical protein [Candidatus Cloacimonadota bacterium]
MKVYEGKDQNFATLIELSALLKALVKKGVITKKEVEAEVPGVVEEIKRTLLLAQMKVPDESKNIK